MTYDVRESTVAPRLVAGVRAQVPKGRVGAEFGRHLEQVYAAGKAGAVQLDGQNVFIYRGATGNMLTVDFCVGAKAPFTTAGAVVPLETPHGPVAMTIHVGDYGRLGEANGAAPKGGHSPDPRGKCTGTGIPIRPSSGRRCTTC